MFVEELVNGLRNALVSLDPIVVSASKYAELHANEFIAGEVLQPVEEACGVVSGFTWFPSSARESGDENDNKNLRKRLLR